MINYRYEPGELERRHEEFVRHGTVALGGPLRDAFPGTGGAPRPGNAPCASTPWNDR
nr:hypothetical protein StreXyl84_68630 [Streptomyces sp. Xyl84]